MKENNLYVRV